MTPQLKLQKQHLDDLQCIREIGETNLKHVLSEVQKLPVAPVHPKELQSTISKALGGDEANADTLIRQLLSLHGLRRQLGLETAEVFAGLDSGLRESGWEMEELKKWEPASGIFKMLFDVPVVQLSAKALDLSYQHSHLLQRAQIITDIRPIYNGDATEIQGTIISHKFLLRYDDIEGEHVLSLAIDEKDIQSLIRQCGRALKKASTAKIQLGDRAKLTTLNPGEE